MTIHAGAVNSDHVYMLMGIPPHVSEVKAVKDLKGKSSHKLLSDFATQKELRAGVNICGVRLVGYLERKRDG
jgi:putative transposase